MALFYTVQDLRAIRACYNSLGLTNSSVLDQIKTTITLMHYDADAVEEIRDVTDEFLRVTGHEVSVDFALSHAIVMTKKLAEVHQKSKGRQEQRV